MLRRSIGSMRGAGKCRRFVCPADHGCSGRNRVPWKYRHTAGYGSTACVRTEDFSSKSATVPLRRSSFVQYVQQMAAHVSAHLSSNGVVDACAPRMWWHFLIDRRVRLKPVGPEKPVALRRSNDDHKGRFQCH